jgi:uncharacterized alpha-E superfamily protein
MLSRIANSLYWMSRYLERMDNTARLIEINVLHMLEVEDSLSEAHQWKPLLEISLGEMAYAALHPTGEVTAKRLIHFMTQEKTNPGSIYNSLKSARENARIVRDRISKEMWEAINELWLQVENLLQNPLVPERSPAFYKMVRNEVARFHGLAESTMLRGEAFGFYELGLYIERADMTCRILDVKYHLILPDLAMVGSPLDYYQWVALLKSISGLEAYRRKFHSGLRPADVANFVIFDRHFPRSLRYLVDAIYQALKSVGTQSIRSHSFQEMSRLLEEFEHSDGEEVFSHGLHEFLKDFIAQLALLNRAIHEDYFELRLITASCDT